MIKKIFLSLQTQIVISIRVNKLIKSKIPEKIHERKRMIKRKELINLNLSFLVLKM